MSHGARPAPSCHVLGTVPTASVPGGAQRDPCHVAAEDAGTGRPVSRRAGQSHQISDLALWLPFSPGGRPRPRGGWGRVCLSMALFLPDHWAGSLSPSPCDPAAQPGAQGLTPAGHSSQRRKCASLCRPARPCARSRPLRPAGPSPATTPHPPPPALPDLHRGSPGPAPFPSGRVSAPVPGSPSASSPAK